MDRRRSSERPRLQLGELMVLTAGILRRLQERSIPLRSPATVLGSKPVPMPYSPPLEDAVSPQVGDIVAAIRRLV